MALQKGLEQNFRFCVLEVTKQIEDTINTLREPSIKLMEKIASRDDYIDHLKTLIENTCIKTFIEAETHDKKIDLIHAILTITGNLERMADLCQSIVSQVRYLSHVSYLSAFELMPALEQAQDCTSKILDATLKRDVGVALRLCRCEFQLDQFYAGAFRRVTEHLQQKGEEKDALTALMICGYVERIGDSLLNIGEAIIASAMGEKLKVHQYEALEESMGAMNVNTPTKDLRFESFWGTRSGCRIGRVREEGATSNSRWTLFKEGKLSKIRQEKQNIDRWESLVPGLPPKVYEFTEHEVNASILLEFLGGNTIQHIVINPQPHLYERSFGVLKSTMKHVWTQTMKVEPIRSSFLSQLRSRMRDVFRVHPHFRTASQQIGSLKTRPFESMLREVSAIEEEIRAPFQVLIHGDFNTDNIIFDDEQDTVHYIDVYRSREGDYAQDVTVFMVSNYRIPIFDSKIRKNLKRAAIDVLDFARGFAREHGDTTFEVRAALGLIRSFFTSTRFELNPKFARGMFLRASYLLDLLLRVQDRLEDFRLPEEILDD